MGRVVRVAIGVGAAAVLALALWVGWELRLGPTATHQVAAGAVIPLASGLGTGRVPAGWTGEVTEVRPGPVAWLQFKSSRTLARQVIDLHSSDGLSAVSLTVTRGPGAWRESLARDRAQTKRYSADPWSMYSEHTDPGTDGGFGGRKSVSLSHIERVGEDWGIRVTDYIWDEDAPAILSIREDHKMPSDPSAMPGPLGAALKAFDFAAASR